MSRARIARDVIVAAALAAALATVGVALLGVLTPGSARAADGEPVLGHARVEVAPAADGHRAVVREDIALTGVRRGATIRGVLAVFDGVTVSGPIVTSGGVRIPVAVARGTDAWTLSLAVPAAAIGGSRTGELRLRVAYTATGSGSTPEVPLFVPAYAAGGGNVVRLVYRVPPGRSVQGDPFPVVIGRTGTQTRDLRAMPAFLGYRLGTATPSGPSVFTWLAVAVLAAAVLLTAAALIHAGRRRV